MIPFLLCWGSFLNVVAYRLVTGEKIFCARSFCPHCKRTVAWYDNIPIFSWFFLLGKCRYCKKRISIFYPIIELLTTGALLTLWYLPPHYHMAYFVFFSALIVTIRSDLETMLISRFVTLFLIPLGFLFSWLGFLPINFWQSVIGAILGYGALYAASKIFLRLTGKEGVGQGDLELLSFIGSFIGFVGCWMTLFFGATIGSIIGILYIVLFGKSREVRIPFGPFLAIGAILYVLLQEKLLLFIFGGF